MNKINANQRCELRVLGAWSGNGYEPPTPIKPKHPDYIENIQPNRITDEQYREAFEWADIVLLPYNEIGSSSGVLLEAMASGRPVVAADIGVKHAMIRQYGGGKLYKPFDGHAFLAAIDSAITEYPLVANREELITTHSMTTFAKVLLK
ncbi:MAG: glycosyltransferase [Puniceicoccales bacterium]